MLTALIEALWTTQDTKISVRSVWDSGSKERQLQSKHYDQETSGDLL